MCVRVSRFHFRLLCWSVDILFRNGICGGHLNTKL